MTPTFSFEQEYWSNDIRFVAGLDEAGMGALAGPVFAAAVLFSQDSEQAINEATRTLPIRDSKLLSERQRERAADFIQKTALSWAIGQASVQEIDALNIRNASHLAMRRAIEQLAPAPEVLLLDGTSSRVHPTIYATAIIKGDQLSYSIAAASILAKVARDVAMRALHMQLPAYGFASHKGYGSAAHMQALQTHGVTEHHRKTYAPIAKLTKSWKSIS